MESLTISLADSRARFVREQAEAEGLSVDAYLDRLVGEAQARAARERLKALMIEGLESGPPIPVTSETWDEIRREAKGRRGARRKAQ